MNEERKISNQRGFVYEVHGPTEEAIRIAEGEDK